MIFHLFSAPNLKGRPRKKKTCPQRRDSFSGSKDPNNNCDGKVISKVRWVVHWDSSWVNDWLIDWLMLLWSSPFGLSDIWCLGDHVQFRICFWLLHFWTLPSGREWGCGGLGSARRASILISQQKDFSPPSLACSVKDVIKCARHLGWDLIPDDTMT
jgi:hypothetical protein